MSKNIKNLLKGVGVDFSTSEDIADTSQSTVSKNKVRLTRKEKHQIELARIAQETALLRVIDEGQRKAEIEQSRNLRTKAISNKMANAFGTKVEKDYEPIRQTVIDDIIPKAIAAEDEYLEPFVEEPLLNKELADFKKKVYEHLRKMGFAAGGGGIGYISDAVDIDTGTAKVDGKHLTWQASIGKWVGSKALLDEEDITDLIGAMVTSNTETGIDVTYNNTDNTIDFVIGTLNQDTTGNAATATAFETPRTIGMTGDVVWTSPSFNGTGDVTGIATIQPNSVTLGTDTTGNYVATVNGTANEIVVNGSGSEIAGITIGLPDNVTIGGDLTIATDDDAKTSVYVLRNTTTTGTQTELFANGSSTDISIASDSTVFFRVSVSARRADADNESAAYIIEGCIDNNGGTTALVGGLGSKTIIAEDSSVWDAIVTADDANDGINVLVTGEASKTIKWVARVETTVVGG